MASGGFEPGLELWEEWERVSEEEEEEEGVHGGGYYNDVELWSWAMGGGWGIQAGDQRRALDDRSNWCVGLASKAASSQSRFQRHQSNSMSPEA